jgi:hypothetical protein
MADASSVRKASSLNDSSKPGYVFFESGLRYLTTNGTFWGCGLSEWRQLVDYVTLHFSADANSVDKNVFIADRAYRVVSVSEAHTVAGGSGAAVTVMKCTGTQAPASGAAVTTAAFDLTATANTVVNATITATAADAVLAAGNRLAAHFAGTLTALAGTVVTVKLAAI